MKNCDEMVNSLLERRARYVAEQKRKKTMFIRTTATVCCVSLAVLLGFGMWQGRTFDTAPPEALNDSINIVEKEPVDPDESNVSADTQTSEINANLNSDKTIISSYNAVEASYAIPENNKFGFSIPLSEAMNKYEDSVLYHVVIDVFHNKEHLSSDSSQVQKECERLSNIGYVAACETTFDGETYRYYFTLRATYEELTEFVTNESYGYIMFLHDERVDSTMESPISSNGFGQ